MKKSNKKKILIIGAGPSGLVALKEMLAAGHDATIIEKKSSFGGVFSLDEINSYQNLYLTTSNLFMAFSDFPPLESQIKYSSKKEYGKYLAAYVAHFDLLKHIEFKTEIKSAKFKKDTWIVEINKGENDDYIYTADNLIVATGSNHIPNTIPLEGFTGDKIHSSEYRNNKAYKNKRVLIIGIGESASDIAAEVSEVSSKTVVWSRRPFLVAPRFAISVMKEKSYDEQKILSKNYHDYKYVNDFLEFLTISRLVNILPMIAFGSVRILLFSIWKTGVFGPLTKLLSFWINQGVKNNNYWQQDQVMVATKSSALATLCESNKIDLVVSKTMKSKGLNVTFSETIIQNDKELKPHSIDFTFDSIIYCTGFKAEFNWLEADIEYNPRTWYKHCFPKNYGEKLMFLGWARPHQGGIPVCAEMLARYGALLISGEKSLPEDYAQRTIAEAKLEENYYQGSPHLDTLVDYPAFMESIAKDIGCSPKMPSIFKNPRLFFYYWIFPNWSCWYRKDGPSANPEAFKASLKIVPLKTSFKLSDGIAFLILHLLLLIVSLPISIIFKMINFISKADTLYKGELNFGWLWKPKGKILHGNNN